MATTAKTAAKTAAKETEEVTKIDVLRIKSVPESFWRAGRQFFNEKETVINKADLTDDQIDMLMNEPKLICLEETRDQVMV